MGWEMRRGRFSPYYTRTRRVGGRRVREYVGGGDRGHRAARQDARARVAREADREGRHRERVTLAEVDALVVAFSRGVDAELRRALEDAGYHQHHRGEWRRRREA